MNEFDETEEDYDDGRPHPIHKIAKIVTPIATCICILVSVFLLLRIFNQNRIPSDIKTLAVNDSLMTAYAEKGEELSIIYQEYQIYSTEKVVRYDERGNPIDNAGQAYFAVPVAIFIPDADQLQLVLRYNTSTLKYLAEDYSDICPTVPDRSEEVFDITVVTVTDLTPENPNDNYSPDRIAEERFTYSDVKSAQKLKHNFYRMTFDGIDLEGVLRVYVCIYYKGDVDYTEDPYATVTVYNSEDLSIPYELTRKDLKALRGSN